MTDSSDVSMTTIDGLISWLNQQRRNNAAASLVDLIDGQMLERNAVLDLACIDLMHRHRNGHPVYAEEYIRDFPQLDRTSDLLDLIDAELCVAAELREPVELAAYCKRFPDLAGEIEELAQLDLKPDVPCFHRSSEDLNSGYDPSQLSPFDASCLTRNDPDSQLSGFSIDPAGASGDQELSNGGTISIEALSEDYPLAIPDWFLVDQCLTRDKDCCLLRGRDDVRGISVAMKIIRVPRLMTDRDIIDLLDVCEAASRVQNPHWVAPQMAAVQMGYLGVIRPWQFANPWQPASFAPCGESGGSGSSVTNGLNPEISNHVALDETLVLRRWRQLAEVAFAIESAHRSGATHGAIHATNLAVDHQGKVCVFDAASSLVALRRWLGSHSTVIQSLDQRIEMDVEDVVTLVCDTARWIPSPASEQLVNQIRHSVPAHEESRLACIGEILMQYADQHQIGQNSNAEPQPRWRTRISRWWLRKN